MKVLVWDFDGTLAFRKGLWSEAIAEVARTHIPSCQATAQDFVSQLQSGFFWHTPEVHHKHIQSTAAWWENLSPVIVRALVHVTGITASQARVLVPAVRSTYIDPSYWALFDDVLPCLRSLSGQGWKQMILSNHVPELPELVKDLGLSPYIAKVFTSATLGYEKPHPAAFGAVRATLPAATSIWMIGDNYQADVLGAKAVGIPGILVRRPHQEATIFLESLCVLPNTIAGV